MQIKQCMENRIDYAYHNNAIQNIDKFLSDNNLKKYLNTNLEKYKKVGDTRSKNFYHETKVDLTQEYLSLGNRTSNNIFFRFYDKTLEVIEKGYKGFFIEVWYSQGLINFYDKYCLTKGYENQNNNYVYKAMLEFYIENGKEEEVKNKFKEILKDPKTTIKEVIKEATRYMPNITRITNVEYETKRKFYSNSDEFIDDMLKPLTKRKYIPIQIKRIYQIIDNRQVFLEYLTRKTVSLKKEENKYIDFWERLRKVKIKETTKVKEELIRKYNKEIDKELIRNKFVNNLATNAVYNKKNLTDFKDDINEILEELSNVNDNNKYLLTKQKKYQRLKNRIEYKKSH